MQTHAKGVKSYLPNCGAEETVGKPVPEEPKKPTLVPLPKLKPVPKVDPVPNVVCLLAAFPNSDPELPKPVKIQHFHKESAKSCLILRCQSV